MSDVDVLLLQLEVEAAAARNADLSQLVEDLQSKLLSTSQALRLAERSREELSYRQPEVNKVGAEDSAVGTKDTQTRGAHNGYATSGVTEEEVTLAMVNLDDALFDLSEALSLLYQDGTDLPQVTSSRRRSLASGQMGLVDLTHDFLSQVQQLKTACEVRIETFEGRLNTLTKQLQEANAQLSQQSVDHQAEKQEYERRIKKLEVQLGARAPEDLVSASDRDILLQYKQSNEQLSLENESLKQALRKLQNDLVLKL